MRFSPDKRPPLPVTITAAPAPPICNAPFLNHTNGICMAPYLFSTHFQVTCSTRRVSCAYPYCRAERKRCPCLIRCVRTCENGYTKRKEAAFAASIPNWLRGLDSNQDKR